MDLKPGDMIHYPVNHATVILMYKHEGQWHYALRSPLENNPDGEHYLKMDFCAENMLTKEINDGNFILFKAKNESEFL